MERIKYLETRLGATRKEREAKEAKYQENFNKYARYMGNGVYSWMGILSDDT